jgi:hypothetical protein
MGKLRRSGFKTFHRVAEGPVLPTWVKVLPVVIGVVLFFLVSSALFADRSVEVRDTDLTASEVDRIASGLDSEELRQIYEAVTTGTIASSGGSVPTDPQVPPSSDVPSNTEVPPATDVPPTGPATEVRVQLLDRVGNPVSVPEGALKVARSAVSALFTGEFGAVPLAPGVSPPALPRLWPDPYVGEPVVDSVGDGAFAVAFVVDPDRDGPALPREIVASVENVAPSGWVWLGV